MCNKCMGRGIVHKDDHPLSVGGCFLYEVGKKSFFMSDLAQYKQACQHYWFNFHGSIIGLISQFFQCSL